MPAPGGHLISVTGRNLPTAPIQTVGPLGALAANLAEGEAPITAVEAAVSSGLWRGETPVELPGSNFGDMAVEVIALEMDGRYYFEGSSSWVSATVLPMAAEASFELP